MTLRPRFSTSLPATLCILAMGLAACNGSKTTPTNLATSKLTVRGYVVDESNVAVAGANVTVGDQTVQTSATGEYTIEPNYKLGDIAVFNVAKPGFGLRSQPVGIDLIGINQNFQLRKHSVTASVALPAVAGANVQVSYPGDANTGGVTLTISGNSLVTSAGVVAQGNVDVSITYWGPNDPFVNTPAPMFGYNGRTASAAASAFLSYGMGDIDIRQNNQALQVATGQNLQLSFNIPQVHADNLNVLTPADPTWPQLWSVDQNAGVWVSEGTAADGRVAYDANTKVIHAALPHLSAWNIDGVGTTNGCVTGTMVDCKNVPVANTDAWLWLMGKGELGHSSIHSGADGKFCTNIAGAGTLTSRNSSAGTAYWFVSLPAAPAATQCNPTGVSSFFELCLGKPASSAACRASEDYTRFSAGIAKCNTPSKDFTMCGYCSGTAKPSGNCVIRDGDDGTPFAGLPFVSGQCTDLGQVVVPTAACGGNTTVKDPCAGKGDMTGKPCDVDVDCCPNAALECKDATCVPKIVQVN